MLELCLRRIKHLQGIGLSRDINGFSRVAAMNTSAGS
ncbi:unnamed protein product, partial [Rotaria magnacalcarata]